MRVDLFDFVLPPERIAERPVSPRDAARMLVVKSEGLYDAGVRDLTRWLRPGDIMVFNDTRVLPARLLGMRGAVGVELLLHKPQSPGPGNLLWQAFAKPAKRLKAGDVIAFADDFFATVEKKYENGEVLVAFDENEASFRDKLHRHGRIPLPPYIEKKRSVDEKDRADYQTIYAHSAKEQSVAAPTAGLHFTPELLAALDTAGIERAHVTLHVGGGTFLPVKAEDTTQHVMHSEWAEITEETAAAIHAARARGGRVVAVGTTSLRTLETASAGGMLASFKGNTDIFITTGHRFRCVDILMTNFHLPRSTLFMLVSAFCGLERMQAAYAHAIAEGYRFYSYGDACLLHRVEPE